MSPSPTDDADETTLGDGSRVARLAIADLAEREGVEPSEVEFVSREEVTWRDGSLGCAKPDTMYTQALIDGQRVVLRLAGKDYEYHSAGKKPGALCENPTQ